MNRKFIRPFLISLALSALPMASNAYVSVGVSINIAPPALPVYVQPPLPAPGYIWTPGYWAYADDDYYWVPGTWVLAPSPGLLWTPGYWGWASAGYIWHAGYWGPHVGFYGGVDYGCGYTGIGFEGGYWRGGAFFYNRAAANFGSVNVTNVYNKTIVNNVTVVNRVSYNGGQGGLTASPTSAQLSAEHERHVGFTPIQRRHEEMAASNRDLRASVNGGKPAIAATARPAVFTGHGVVAARAAGGPVHVADHGSAAHATHASPEVHANRSDRPAGATGASRNGFENRSGHTGATSSGPTHVAQLRTDRPPGAQGAGNAHGTQESFNPRAQRTDRPQAQHSNGGSADFHRPAERSMPHENSAPHFQNSQPHMQNSEAHMQSSQSHAQSQMQPHMQNPMPRMPGPPPASHSQAAPRGQEQHERPRGEPPHGGGRR